MDKVSLGQKRVLVVDDEQKFCSILSQFLVNRGYEVNTASTRTDALAILEQFKPNIVLLDLVMPGLSGLELLKLVRERTFPPRVIMVTAREDEQAAQQAMRYGAEAYVCKPVNLDALERLISGFWPPQPPTPSQ